MNKIELIGRLAKDPVINDYNGTKVTKLTIAVTRQYKKGETDFINCTAFGKTAENIAKFFSKGGLIAIVGSLRINNYQDDLGNWHYSSDVNIENFYFLGNNGGQNNNNNNSNSENYEDMMPFEDDGDIPF